MVACQVDARGRPVVAVTGLGLVTSLGQGLATNWQGLTEGRSGLRRIDRFTTDGLHSNVAGCVGFMGIVAYSAFELSRALASGVALVAVEQSGSGSRGNFPGPLFVGTRASELVWPQLEWVCGRGSGV